jgi:hypothetical protein
MSESTYQVKTSRNQSHNRTKTPQNNSVSVQTKQENEPNLTPSSPQYQGMGSGAIMANIKRTIDSGNYPVNSTRVQPKLTVGAPGDRYEQEADHVASQVVQRINSSETPDHNQDNNTIQRKLEISTLQRAEEPQEEELQMKGETSVGNINIQADFETNLNSARSGGSPLDQAFRAKVEPQMGADFSSVRVHTDSTAHNLSQSIQAKAFTTGKDIFFKQGTYDPHSRGGQELLTHELTHVVQQNSATVQPMIQRETYLDQRGVSSHYTGVNDETKIQRPGLLGAIGSVVTQLQQASADYENAFKSGKSFAELQPLIQRRNELHEFLRLQDVDVDQQGNLAPDALKDRLVEYDETPGSQLKTLVNISGGTLTRNDGSNTPVDTSNSVTFQTGKGWEIFVMSPTGELHMASHKIGKYHHSSLLAGAPTAAAGSIKAINGTIDSLNNKSGHYQPGPKQMRQVLHRLQKAGVNMNFNLQILGPPADQYNGTAADYIKPGGEGDLNNFEMESATRILHHFIAVKGKVRCQTAFASRGWSLDFTGGNIFARKGPSTLCTHEEVRDVLTSYFKDPGPVDLTIP